MSASSYRRVNRLAAVACAAVAVTVGLTGCGAVSDLVMRELDRTSEDGGSSLDEDGKSSDEIASDEGNTDVLAVRTGDCIDDAEVAEDESVTEIASLEVVPCTEPHDSEAFGSATYEDGEYPGDDMLYAIADEQCVTLFEDYVGTDYESSSLDFSYYTPTRLSWKYGDREALCVLYDMELEQLIGSAEDSGL